MSERERRDKVAQLIAELEEALDQTLISVGFEDEIDRNVQICAFQDRIEARRKELASLEPAVFLERAQQAELAAV